MINDRRTKLPKFSWAQVSARRLERNALSVPAQNVPPADIVRVMCGAHAQVMTAAELSIGLRIRGITKSDIRAALWDEHSLVKTYGPRGTVHLLPMQDLPLWCGALSATPYGESADPRNELLTPEQSETVITAIAEVLAEGELTTDELTEALIERVGPWAGEPVMPAFQGLWPRWRMAQATAGVRGALCFGPNRGRKVTFTNPCRLLPGFRPADQQTSLAALVKHYLFAYGPATPQQFAQWLAVPPRWAADLFDSLSDELQQVEFEGSLAWVAAGDTGQPATQPESLRLLPYFDAFMIGSHPRSLLYPGQAGQRLASGLAGNFQVLLIDGSVAGVWHQRRSGRKIEITVEPLVELTAAQRRSLDDQVARVGEILAGSPNLNIGIVKTGPHA